MTPNQIVFLRRLGSSVVLWGVSLTIILTGYELGFMGLIGGLAMVGLWEYFRMLEVRGLPHFKGIGLVCGALLNIGTFYCLKTFGPEGSYVVETAALVGLLLVIFSRQMFEGTRDGAPLESMAYTFFGLMYVPWLFGFVGKVVYLMPRDAAGHLTGHFYVLWLVLVTKFSDMGAYVTGSLCGRHLLVPHISPKKTWEGFLGALAFSTGGAWGLVVLIPDKLSFLQPGSAAVLGLVLGFAAVVGDLAESIVKRSAGAKDSGAFLPGIGGALDLIDSILFTAPLLFFYLRLQVSGA